MKQTGRNIGSTVGQNVFRFRTQTLPNFLGSTHKFQRRVPVLRVEGEKGRGSIDLSRIGVSGSKSVLGSADGCESKIEGFLGATGEVIELNTLLTCGQNSWMIGAQGTFQEFCGLGVELLGSLVFA